MDWTDKTILITGASSGIGLETAKAFLEKGALVYMNGRNSENLEKAAATLNHLPGIAAPLPGDVSIVSECERMFRQVIDDAAGLDVLINAAGIWVEGQADEVTEAQWDTTMNINAKGTFFMCRYAIPLLEVSRGAIVNVCSDSGLMGNKEAAVYCASKGAVTLITKSLAVELAARGIRVNAVCPTEVDTPMLEKAFQESEYDDREGYYQTMLKHYPQGESARFIRPREVAETILFLASPSAQAITGACLPIDFGRTAGY